MTHDSVKLLTAGDVSRLLTRQLAYDAARESFLAYSTASALSPMPFEMIFPEHRGEVHAKGGYRLGAESFSVKVASAFVHPVTGETIGGGLTLVFDATTGHVSHLIADDGLLTVWRTAAATAFATDLLARDSARNILLVGSGIQTRENAAALSAVQGRQWRCSLWARSRDRASRLASRLEADGTEIQVVDDLGRAVEAADVIVTATSTRNAGLIDPDWITPGTHITSIGADAPGKRELKDGVLELCDVLVTDSRALAETVGELPWEIAQGRLDMEAVAEVGEIVAGLRPGRRSDDQVTLADLAGIGIQDATIAAAVVRAAGEAGVGRRIHS